jgi:hypothetical protein
MQTLKKYITACTNSARTMFAAGFFSVIAIAGLYGLEAATYEDIASGVHLPAFTKELQVPIVHAWNCLSFEADPSTIEEGESVTLSWDVDDDVTKVTIDNGVGEFSGHEGSTTVKPTQTTEYTLTTHVDWTDDTRDCKTKVTVTTPTGDDDDDNGDDDDDNGNGGDDDDDNGGGNGDDDDDNVGDDDDDDNGNGGGNPGGRGPCLNCGDDDDDDDDNDNGRGDDDDDDDNGNGGGDDDDDNGATPNITLDRNVVAGTPSGIFLDQVPYTGFEAGPVMTVLFWFGIFGLSALLAYAFTMRRTVVAVQGAEDYRLAAFGNRGSAYNPVNVARDEYESESVTSFADLGGKGTNGREEEIEARAHNESILLSPEALRAVVAELERRGEDVEAFTDRLFEEAKGQFVREDGWILLSKERVNTLLGNNKDRSESRPARESRPEPRREEARREVSARANPAPTVADTVEYEGTVSTVTTFITWLAANEQQKVYNFVRKLSSQGYSVDNFIGQVLRALDDVYKNRLEGNRNPDPSLAEKTATWSNADLEAILGILVECIDYSYSSSRIGTKVALAKVFEYLAQKENSRKR